MPPIAMIQSCSVTGKGMVNGWESDKGRQGEAKVLTITEKGVPCPVCVNREASRRAHPWREMQVFVPLDGGTLMVTREENRNGGAGKRERRLNKIALGIAAECLSKGKEH